MTPVRILTNVDLPAPLAPSRARDSPGWIDRFALRRAMTEPYCFAIPVACNNSCAMILLGHRNELNFPDTGVAGYVQSGTGCPTHRVGPPVHLLSWTFARSELAACKGRKTIDRERSGVKLVELRITF